MDHDAVVRQKITERYLLNELDPEARDEFEEHYFDCPDCAADVHAGALFVEQSKVVLGSEESKGILLDKAPASPTRAPVSAGPGWFGPGWFGWLRPAFAVPVLALLLSVIAYQTWSNSRWQQAANSPQLLASAVVNLNVRGEEAISVPGRAGQAFGLSLNIPPDGRFLSYRLDLYNSQGKLEWSRTFPASGNDTLSLYVPASDQVPSKLAVFGITAGGESSNLGQYSFEFQKP